ncbi:MAG: DUF2169 domain-containing protein [Enhygromyxa sp.]
MLIRTALRGPVDYCVAVDPDGRERLVAVAKQSYALPERDGDELRLLPRSEQSPLIEVDMFSGDPASSAPLLENDYAAFKPRCDVLVHACAHAPAGRPAREVEVEVGVGNWRKRLRVLGERVWTGGIAGARLTEPVAFERMEISYERAFGGVQLDPADPSYSKALRENPVGVGYYPFSRGSALDGLIGPNCEALDDPVRSCSRPHRPAALGPIGRSWLPRLSLAGTYDQRWVEERFPFLPADFRYDYFQSAPGDQQISPPRGGETCRLINLSPSGSLSFSLPVTAMPVEFVRADRRRVETTASMDTLVIDASTQRVTMTWRASLALERGVEEVRELVFGAMTPGWVRARETGKSYYRSLAELIDANRQARLGAG